MADTFWNGATPVVAPGERASTTLAGRVAGDVVDKFVQVPLSQVGAQIVDAVGAAPDAGISQRAATAGLQGIVDNLAAPVGADSIRTARQLVSASGRGAARIVAIQAQDRFDFRDWNGAQIGTLNDMGPVMTAALAESSASDPLNIPFSQAGITLGSTVAVKSGAHIAGRGVIPYGSSGPYTNGTSRGPGSWFKKAHNGVGFAIADTGIYPSNVHLTGIGIYEDQPAPAAGWTPNLASDFHVTSAGARLVMRDVCFLNPTRAFRQLQGYGGHIQCQNVHGQPMLVGAQIDDGYEGFSVGGPVGIRWWPFWSDDPYTRAYTQANRKGLYLRHIDNPKIEGFFDFGSAFPIFIGSHPNGVPNNVTLIHPELDNYGNTAIYFEAGCDGAHVSIRGGYAYGITGAQNAVLFQGTNNVFFSAPSMRFQETQKRIALINGGTGNTMHFGMNDIGRWNVAGSTTDEAFATTNGNKIIIDRKPLDQGGNGAALINNQALIASDIAITSTPTVTSSVGTLGAASCVLVTTRTRSYVHVQMQVTVTTNGTGDGSIVVPLPVPSASGLIGTLSGRLANGSGGQLQAQINGSTCNIQTGVNTYPAIDGSILVLEGRYKVADL